MYKKVWRTCKVVLPSTPFVFLTFSLPWRRRIVSPCFSPYAVALREDAHSNKRFPNSTGVNPCAVKLSHNFFWIFKLHLFVILTVIDPYIYIQEITSFSPTCPRLPQSSSVVWCKGRRVYRSSLFPFSRVIHLVSGDFSRSGEGGYVNCMTEVM